MTKSTERLKKNELIKKSSNPRLRRMLILLLVIAFVMLAYVVFSTIKNGANPLYVMAGLIGGVLLGLLFARMFKLSWDNNNAQVIYRIDIIGLVLLLAFLIFDFTRSDLVADVISGPSVKPVSFALLAGTFYGRVYGIGHTMLSILREQKILPNKG